MRVALVVVMLMFSFRSLVTASVSTLALTFAVGCGSGTEGAVDGSEVDTNVDESATYATSGSTAYTGGTYGGFTQSTYDCVTLAGECVSKCPQGWVVKDGKCVGGADGLSSDSGPSSCSEGYYLCWSNVQQKSVCTTRKCY